MALESVNPPVIITARVFFLRSKNRQHFLEQHLEQQAKKEKISQARTWGKPIIKLG